MVEDQVVIEQKKTYDVTIDCYGHTMRDGKPFTCKTSEVPKGCSKCLGRLHKGFDVTHNIPIICNCLRKILVLDDPSEVKEELKQEIIF